MVTSGGGAPPVGVAVYRFADNSNPEDVSDDPHYRSGYVDVLPKALILPTMPSTLVALQDSDALEVYAPAGEESLFTRPVQFPLFHHSSQLVRAP